MKRLLSIPIYLWAIVCALIIPVTFMGNHFFAERMATLSFMKINPIYSGGDSLRTYQQDSLKIIINKPVFAALFGESSKGYVQVKFKVAGKLPERFISDVDYDGDGKPDFEVTVDTQKGQTSLKPLSSMVLGLRTSSKVKEAWVVRVEVLNPSKR